MPEPAPTLPHTPTPTPRFTLRQLPLPAKWVITCFLLVIGLGYTSAMVQLHMQDAKGGTAFPTVEDVVLKYTGKRWYETAPPRPVSKLERLIMGPAEGVPWNGNGSMAAAFFKKDGGDYNKLTKNAAEKPKIDAERDGERHVLQFWINLPDDQRKAAYDSDHLMIPADKLPKAVTPAFLDNPTQPTEGIKVKTILEERCVRCHVKDGEVSQFPLEKYAELERYMTVPPTVTVPPGGGWVRVEEPMGLEKLTQTTHAHLLSFAMLFTLTGLTFSLTGYPVLLRAVFGPLSLLSVTADVGLWWLARLCDHTGPYFAMGIMITGGLTGLGLAVQIVLSVFDLYGWKGKGLLLVLFALGAAGGFLVYTNQIRPGLEAKWKKLHPPTTEKTVPVHAEGNPTPAPTEPAKPEPKTNTDAQPPKPEPKASTDAQPPTTVTSPMSVLERALTGKFVPDGPWATNGKVPEGGMVRAFFDKESEYKTALKKKSARLATLTKERETEHAALLAWAKSPPADRKKAYEADLFPFASAETITEEFQASPKAVKVRSLIDARCVTCHTNDNEVPLEDFKGIEKVLQPSTRK